MFEFFRATISQVVNSINIKRYGIACTRRKITLNGVIFFGGKGKIILGENVKINSGSHYNPIGGDTRTIIIAEQSGEVIIKNNVGISNSTIVSHQSILIEDDVQIGGNSKIYDTDFHSLNYGKRLQKPDPDIKTAPVIIKKGAFIGAHVIILKGVTIGEQAIVGAGSVVSCDIPDFEIWGGNPARFIRKIKLNE